MIGYYHQNKIMRLLHQFSLFCVGVIIPFFLSVKGLGMEADPDPSEAWKLKFASAINWHRITPFGNLVVSTGDGLYGVDPDLGRITWVIKRLGGIPYDSYQPLPNTFYAQISLSNQLIILEPYEGSIISDTKKAGFTTVVTKNILHESGAILISGYKDEQNASLSLFDMGTGRELWNNTEIFAGSKRPDVLINSLNAGPGKANADICRTFKLIEAGVQGFIIANGNIIYKVNTQTGDLIWKAEPPRPEGMVIASDEPRLIRSACGAYFYYIQPNYLMGYNIKNGRQLWAEVGVTGDSIYEFIAHKKGLILLPEIDKVHHTTEARINLIDYVTGKALWGKKTLWGKKARGIAVPGTVVNIDYHGKDLVLTMADDDTSYLNVLDVNNGRLMFENSLKINGRLGYTEMTKSGLLYIAKPNDHPGEEINIFDLQNGRPRLAKFLKPGKPSGQSQVQGGRSGLLTAFQGNLLYVFADKEQTLYEINLNNANVKALKQEISFGGNEKVNRLEVRVDGLLLGSTQNIMLVGFDGQLKFHKYYPAPEQPGLSKSLRAMEALYTTFQKTPNKLGTKNADRRVNLTKPITEWETVEKTAHTHNGRQTKVRTYSKSTITAAKRRSEANRRSPDFVFMIVSLQKQDKNVANAAIPGSYGLVRVSKTTGEIIETLQIKDEKEPGYQVDDVLNAIYYRNRPSEIVGYKFEK